jgi:hypothetical protein
MWITKGTKKEDCKEIHKILSRCYIWVVKLWKKMLFASFYFSNFPNYRDRVSGLALNCNPPDLCLQSSYDYRCEPPAPGSNIALKIIKSSFKKCIN